MVEQTRRQNHVVSLQAGPGEVDGGALNNVTRAVGRQLAVIGDQMMRDLASREPTWPAVPINLFRPAQVLTRTIYRYMTPSVAHLHFYTSFTFIILTVLS
uniref:Uncharacterized protein n=1 Tax=Oryzias melastigma TaxID=30732 RepID=A0A3B3D3N0_ORYME